MSTQYGMIEHHPLAPLTTLGIGGPARYYVRATTPEAVRDAAVWARERGKPLLVLGGGSNLLVSDDGFPGLVLHVMTGGVEKESASGAVLVTVGAGERWDDTVAWTVEHGLAGLECLSGIPGFVGATPIQNVGAYGQEVSETIDSVRALNLETLEEVEFRTDECRFGYRDSRFKQEDRGRYVVLAVRYRLSAGGQPAVRYPELESFLGDRGIVSPSLADARDAVLAIRKRKSMVLDPNDPDARSAGSFFVNPVITIEEFARVESAAGPDTRVPRYAAGETKVKVPAAWLIERAGFRKGHRRGAVGLSSKHSLAIVNAGGATAADVVALAREIRDGVRDAFGVELVPEPVFVNVSIGE